MENDEFIKLTKKEKLKLPYIKDYSLENISIALFIPLRVKNDGYTMCAFFVQQKGKWYRMMDYDCFRFIDTGMRLKGDFENDGVQFFLGDDNWTCDYGGKFKRVIS